MGITLRFRMGKWEGTSSGKEAYKSIQKNKDGKIASRLFDKALRDHIILYLPKIMDNLCKYICMYTS